MISDAREGDPSSLQQLTFIRDEIRFEIGLLHDRVNALLAAEAFLTIAYTAAMSNGTSWGATFSRIAAPILSVLGLSLALLAWPGVNATVKIVLEWTSRERRLFDDNPSLLGSVLGGLIASSGNQHHLDLSSSEACCSSAPSRSCSSPSGPRSPWSLSPYDAE